MRQVRSGGPDVAVFSARGYDRQFLDAANDQGICRLHYFDATLDADTVRLAAGHEVVCVFVNDQVDAAVLEALATNGTRRLRCAAQASTMSTSTPRAPMAYASCG